MSAQISQGTQVAIAATYGAAKTMSVVSNATAAVATLESSHGVIVGDIVEVSSGWDLLDKRLARASVVATNDVTLESIDTSSTTRYPAGEGIGTVREILTWTSITQISDFAIAASTVEFADITTLMSQVRREIPSLESAPKATASFFYDLSLAWIATVLAASQSRALTGLRMITPSANKIYWNAYWNLSMAPQVAIGQAIKQGLEMSLIGWPTGYSS